MLTLGSLFDGIGGFPLAARWLGIHTLWTCEIDQFCHDLSLQNFPEIKTRYRDIRSMTDEKNYIETVSIISAGFPCQPFSAAGKRGGDKDDRYLWSQTIEVIKKVRPAWVVLENVPGIINMALDNVLADLEAAGYQHETFIIPAISVGAYHRRDRVWIIAHRTAANRDTDLPDCEEIREVSREKQSSKCPGICSAIPHPHSGQRSQQREHKGMGRLQQSDEKGGVSDTVRSGSKAGGKCTGRQAGNKPSCSGKANADTVRQGLQEQWQRGGIQGEKRKARAGAQRGGLLGAERYQIEWPTEPPICGTAHGIPRRVDRIKALGNAIVPQIADKIFRCILAAEGLV